MSASASVSASSGGGGDGRGDKRTVATDATATLGTMLVQGREKRDAIHLAVEPVVAAEDLFPNDDVGLNSEGRASKFAVPHLGKVDPFLRRSVHLGDSFWLVVYPGAITSLRHVWEHPLMPITTAAASNHASTVVPATSIPTTHKTPEATNLITRFSELLASSTQEGAPMIVHPGTSELSVPSSIVGVLAAQQLCNENTARVMRSWERESQNKPVVVPVISPPTTTVAISTFAPVVNPVASSAGGTSTIKSVAQSAVTAQMSKTTPNVQSDESTHEDSNASDDEDWSGQKKSSAVVASASSVAESRKYIKQVGRRLGVSADRMIQAADDWLESQEYFVGGDRFEGKSVGDIFWNHYSVVTGKKVPESQRNNFIDCSC